MLHTTRRQKGFTLIELAIVLTIAGLLFVGLWRLLAGGNAQVRDQSVSNEQQQLIAAVKGYLSANPDGWLQALPAAGASATLALPPAANAPATPGLVSFLPSGFTNATPNAYGQTYTIKVIRNDTTPTTQVPTTYSFMVVTSGGDTIPDASGGRISAGIGNDGGFIYSSNVCTLQTGTTAPNSACGAYGTWATNVATAYGFAGTTGGHVASRTFVSPSADNLFPWLERNTTIQPDPTFGWNTMSTDLYMGGTSKITPGTFANIYMAPSPATTMGGSTIYLQGGTIQEINDANNTAQISMTATGALESAAFINLITNCTIDTVPNGFGLPPDARCRPGVQVNGDENITGMMQAFDFYAQSFVYQASDIRFKTNVHPIVNSLDDIMRLKPVTYTLKSNGREGLGVIAQDLEKIYPQLVSDSNGMKSVAYDGLIAPLIGAVQELKKENDQLRDELRSQAVRQQQLEDKLKNQNP